LQYCSQAQQALGSGIVGLTGQVDWEMAQPQPR
jgi:hypothetical protein